MRVAIALMFVVACFGQGRQNVVQTGTIVPPQATFASPPSSPATGAEWTFIDASAAGTCTGGGSAPAKCRWSGSAWQAIGGSSQASVLGGGGSIMWQRQIECATGTVSLSGGTWTYPGGTVAAASATRQEIPIITGLTGDLRYTHVLLAESTQFASSSVTVTKLSLGRPGSNTNDEMLPQTSFMVSSGNAWFAEDRPQMPILGTANTYSLVLAIRTTGDNVSALTAGSAYYEVCGYALH